MNRPRWLKGLAIAAALFAVVAVAQATFSIVADPGLKFRGQWFWNSATSSRVQTRVENLGCDTVLVRVDVKARALDGTTVGANTLVQVPPQEIREVSQLLSKPITPLQFIQLRYWPANGPPPTPCNGNPH